MADNVQVTTTPTSATFTSSQVITVDAGGDPCAGDGTTTVVCTVAAGGVLSGVNVSTSSANDAITVNGPVPADVSAGAGNDAILGSDVNGPITNPATGFESNEREFLDGGSGTDLILARGGNDFASGGDVGNPAAPVNDDGDVVDLGAGNDGSSVSGSGDGVNDQIQGGAGIDEVSVSGSTPQVNAATVLDTFSANLTAGTLAKTNNAPENNAVAGFEDYTADFGTGGNSVTGTAGSNIISGGSKTDIVNPLGGGDQLRLEGGDDAADTRDGSADRISCGSGTDTVAADQFDELLDCERVTVTKVRPAGADVVAPTCKVTKLKGKYTRTSFFKGFTPKVNCNEPVTMTVQVLVAVRKTGKLVTGAKVGDLVLAEKTYKLGSGNRGSKLRPSKRLGKRLGKRFKAVIRVTAQDEFGNRRAVTKRTAVKTKAKKKSKKKGSNKKGSKKRK